ncbi:hypothetical protein NDU88_001874 [Pleurodeles waltl]|uniref:Uncharacterized protein n=1 Tax=Pleurodeles waltl TaxID=8319 RepID=A0AAV7NEP8_PLEWA|nr:hypothetical protein NDU88_001874 [Pleurodeles waltl]
MSERHTPEESVLLIDQEDLLLAEDIVHARDASVAQSVNWALALVLSALKSIFRTFLYMSLPEKQLEKAVKGGIFSFQNTNRKRHAYEEITLKALGAI